jgi:hypothetical protein
MLEIERKGRHIGHLTLTLPNIKFDVELRGHLTIIEGDSNTHKSHFLKALANECKLYPNELSSQGITGIALLDNKTDHQGFFNFEDYIKKLKKVKCMLVLIDDADIILRGPGAIEFINFVSFDTNNQYVIVSRRGLGIGVSLNHFCTLEATDNVVKSVYRYNEMGWM